MRHGFDPWVWKIPWRRAWQPTPVFFPGESHGQRSLAGYSPWGHKGSDLTWQLNNKSPIYEPSSCERSDSSSVFCQGQVWVTRHLPPLPSPTADDSSALPYPTESPSPSSCLFARFQSVCQLLYCTTGLFKELFCKTKHAFLVFAIFVYYLCEEYYKPIIVQFYNM